MDVLFLSGATVKFFQLKFYLGGVVTGIGTLCTFFGLMMVMGEHNKTIGAGLCVGAMLLAGVGWFVSRQQERATSDEDRQGRFAETGDMCLFVVILYLIAVVGGGAKLALT